MVVLPNTAYKAKPFDRLSKGRRQHGRMIYTVLPTGDLTLTDHFVHVVTTKVVEQLRQFYLPRHNLQSRLLLVFTLTSVQY